MIRRLFTLSLILPLLVSCVGPRLLPESENINTERIVQDVLNRKSAGLPRLIQAIGLLEGRLYPEYRDQLTQVIVEEFNSLKADPAHADSLQTLWDAYGTAYPISPIETSSQPPVSLTRGEGEPMPVWVDRVSRSLAQSSSSFADLTADDLEALTEYGIRTGSREILNIVGNGQAFSGFDPLQAVRATVTVLVDEGISVSNGIGSPQVVIGSGFFIDQEGHLLTNYHVIRSQVDPEYKGSSKLTVRLFSEDGRGNAPRVPARVVGYDEILDLALLKTEAVPPSFLSLSSLSLPRPGQQVVAIGSPGGLEHTITSGIVSALGRRFLQLGDVFQVDIPINPGNSGGPVFDDGGMVIGVVFAGIQQFDGVNFIIPSAEILPVLARLYEGGQVPFPWIGLNLYERQSRLFVSYVAPNGPLGGLPIRADDEVVSISGIGARTIAQAQRISLGLEIGDLAVIGLRRPDGSQYSLAFQVGQRPVLPFKEILGDAIAARWLGPLFGIAVSRLEQEGGYPRFRIERIYPGSPGDEAGLNEHDSFGLMRWIYDEEQEIAAIQISIERRNSGYVPEVLQLAVYIAVTNFI